MNTVNIMVYQQPPEPRHVSAKFFDETKIVAHIEDGLASTYITVMRVPHTDHIVFEIVKSIPSENAADNVLARTTTPNYQKALGHAISFNL
jgi:hypothetical protein